MVDGDDIGASLVSNERSAEDLDVDQATVLPAAAGEHMESRARSRCLSQLTRLLIILGNTRIRDQSIQFMSQGLLGREVEQALGCRIPGGDAAILVCGDDRDRA